MAGVIHSRDRRGPGSLEKSACKHSFYGQNSRQMVLGGHSIKGWSGACRGGERRGKNDSVALLCVYYAYSCSWIIDLCSVLIPSSYNPVGDGDHYTINSDYSNVELNIWSTSPYEPDRIRFLGSNSDRLSGMNVPDAVAEGQSEYWIRDGMVNVFFLWTPCDGIVEVMLWLELPPASCCSQSSLCRLLNGIYVTKTYRGQKSRGKKWHSSFCFRGKTKTIRASRHLP